MDIFPRRRTTGLLFAGSSAEQRCTKVVGVAQRRDAEEAGWSLSFFSLRFRVLSIRMTMTRLREEERRRRRWHWFSSDDDSMRNGNDWSWATIPTKGDVDRFSAVRL
nr:hypothetical protein Iba_chr02fCG11270 [Ipomoea batatas]